MTPDLDALVARMRASCEACVYGTTQLLTINHLHVLALLDALDAARADLREAFALLRQRSDWNSTVWFKRRDALLSRHGPEATT